MRYAWCSLVVLLIQPELVGRGTWTRPVAETQAAQGQRMPSRHRSYREAGPDPRTDDGG